MNPLAAFHDLGVILSIGFVVVAGFVMFGFWASRR